MIYYWLYLVVCVSMFLDVYRGNFLLILVRCTLTSHCRMAYAVACDADHFQLFVF